MIISVFIDEINIRYYIEISSPRDGNRCETRQLRIGGRFVQVDRVRGKTRTVRIMHIDAY
jgi:hypothetical protein